MKRLPLYDGPASAPVDSGAEPLDRNCTKCVWSEHGPTTKACLPADAGGALVQGGLLVVGDAPTRGAARPFASKSGTYVRQLVSKSWRGPVVYDYAVKCAPKGGAKLKDAARPIKECRPYLAEVVRQAKPSRVIAVGSWAAMGLLGRGLDLESARRGYGWILGDVPVFFVHGPVAALENKFIRRRYERDFEWALTCDRPQPSHLSGIVHVVEDMDDALDAEEFLKLHGELLFDVETAGMPHSEEFTILCAGLAAVDEQEGDAWVWSAAALADPDARASLSRLLLGAKISGSSVKYDTSAANQRLGIDVRNIGFDTQLVRKLLDPLALGRLEYVVELVGMGGSKEEASSFRKKAVAAIRRKKPRPDDPDREHWCSKAILAGGVPDAYSFGLLPEDLLHQYNGRDVVGSAAGTIHLRRRAETEAAPELACWETLYRPSIKSFERIERTGFPVDRQAFEAFSAYLNVGLAELHQRFKAWDTQAAPFNPNSHQQVATILYDKLKLPKPRNEPGKSGIPSTDKSELARLRGRHQFVDDMIEYRRLEKMDVQYAAGMIPHIRWDGRIHTSFRPDGTETGRISSENPNSQNLPRAESVEGKMCRDCFTSSEGRVLIELDQSQIELRVAAGMSGDELMQEIFRSGLDYHLRTAQLISRVAWGIEPEAAGEWHRSAGKIINFALLYGKTDQTLAVEIGCSVEEATKIRQSILGTFKKLAQLIKRLSRFANTNGYVDVPWLGDAVHSRPLYEIASHDKWKRSNAENSSINTPIQGRASWYTLASLPLIHDWIDRTGAPCEIVNTVHDSIMLDVEPEWVDVVADECRVIMESFDCWGVPLRVDLKAGDRWGSLRKVKRGERYAEAQVRWVAEALAASKH